MTEPALNPAHSAAKPRHGWLACLGLVVAYLALRLPHLRDMPAFTDEATYARWVQLILADPGRQLFVSMSDAKPPLHYWLMALTRGLAADPIMAGRLLSVFLGVLVFPALFALCSELARLERRTAGFALLLSILAGVLLITSPLIAMQQRMIMAEALLLPEAVAMAWLSLRIARLASDGAPMKKLLIHAAALGALWAASLLTKQIFSYFLWAFAPLAAAIYCRRGSWKSIARRFAPVLALTTLIGVACFVPVVLSNSTLPLNIRLLYKPMFLPQANANRFVLAWTHVVELFWPQADGKLTPWPHDPRAPLENGILYLYLTPPILLLTLAAFGWMIRRRAWPMAIFLAGWTLVFFGSFLFGAGVIMSRYAAVPAVPLLIAAAWLIADIAQTLRARIALLPAAGAVAAMGAAAIAWPAGVTVAGVRSWQAPVYTAFDAEQYVTDFGGGHVTERTILWLAEQAAEHPITVITGSWVGTPNDTAWLYLSGNPNIRLYWDDYHRTLLHPVAPDTYLLGSNRWADKADKRVVLDLSRPTYYIVPITHFRKAGLVLPFVPPEVFPPHQVVQHFDNPKEAFETMDYIELVVIRLEPGAKVVQAFDGKP